MSQQSFPNSRFDSFWYSQIAVCDVPCDVRFGDGLIEVAYDEDGGKHHYTGFEVRDGHFELKCPEIAGKATLHMFSIVNALTDIIINASWEDESVVALLSPPPGTLPTDL